MQEKQKLWLKKSYSAYNWGFQDKNFFHIFPLVFRLNRISTHAHNNARAKWTHWCEDPVRSNCIIVRINYVTNFVQISAVCQYLNKTKVYFALIHVSSYKMTFDVYVAIFTFTDLQFDEVTFLIDKQFGWKF